MKTKDILDILEIRYLPAYLDVEVPDQSENLFYFVTGIGRGAELLY